MDKSVRMWRETHSYRSKANAVWVEPDDKVQVKPFCEICKTYYVYIKDKGYECPQCGNEYEDKKDDDRLVNEFKSEPMVKAIEIKKKRPRSDFPPGASITEDIEISSVDGSETELIIDDSDV